MDLKEAIDILLDEEYLEDYIYTVRTKAIEANPKWVGSSWDHPRVRRFQEVLHILRQHQSSLNGFDQ